MAKKKLTTAYMVFSIDHDPDSTDAESLSNALDTLMDTAMSTPGILDDYGDVHTGAFFPIDPEDIKHLHEVAMGPITQPQRDALANILDRLGVLKVPGIVIQKEEPDYCDECKASYPPEATDMVGSWHAISCSLYEGPANHLPGYDVQFEKHGSVAVVQPLNNKGRAWVQEKLSFEKWQVVGGTGVAVEPKMIDDLRQNAIDDGLKVNPPTYSHQYSVKVCPECQANLTLMGTDTGVLIETIDVDVHDEFYSVLDQDGKLVDEAGVVAAGLHSETSCRKCGHTLSEYEIFI